MHRASRRLALLAACALAPLAAAAQTPAAPAPPDAAQAQALQDAVRGWMAGLLGPLVPLPKNPIAFAPEGDHYRVSIDFSALPGIVGSASTTATARPLDAGRWALDNIQTSQPLAFRVDLPATKDHPAGPFDLTLKIASQDTHAIVDPALATPTTMSSKLGAYDLTMAGPGLHQIQHLDGSTSAMSIVPAANGRLDVTQEVSGDNFSSTRSDPGTDPFEIAAQKLALSAHLDGIDRQRAPAALQLLFQAAKSAETKAKAEREARPAGPGGAKATAKAAVPDKATLRALYLAWRGLATGGAVTESLDQLRVVAAGHEGAIRHVSVGGAVATTGGMLNAHLTFAMDGIDSPELPPMLRDYLPRHLAIQPSVSAIDLADLDALILALTAPGDQKTDPAPLIAAMFAHGGIVAGIDTLELDVGPAHLVGTGKVTALAPDRLRGDAEISVTGFDALADKINAEPAFASALPVITMVRGLGRQQGDRMVWQITSENGDIKVNGTDMTALLGQARNENGHPRPQHRPRP